MSVDETPTEAAAVQPDERKIEVGDRFEDLDERSGNRVIRIIQAPTLSRPVRYEVEVAELNPATVGRKHTIKAKTLRERYKRISR